MFNKSVNSGFTFGNQNTSTPTSTPAQPSSSLQFPQKSTGLFGNVNANANTSTPSPSGGLFNVNSNANTINQQPANNLLLGNKPAQPPGGLFGGANNSTSKSTGSLFGNNSSTTNSTGSTGLFGNNSTGPAVTNGGLFGNGNNNNITSATQNGGLFGKPTTTPAGTGSLFGNSSSTNSTTGLFGSNNTQGSTSLFGQKPGASMTGGLPGNNGVPFARSGETAGSMSTNPYGINISNVPMSVVDMPKSITSSLTDGNGKSHVASKPIENKRTYSFSSTIPGNSPLPRVSQSSLVTRLSTRLKATQKSTPSNEIFSPSYTKPWLNGASSAPLMKDFSASKITPLGLNENGNFPTNGFTFLSSQKADLSELRKLKIDSNRSAAKKLKLLSGGPAITKTHMQDEKASLKNESVANTDNITHANSKENKDINMDDTYLNGKDQSNNLNTKQDGENTVQHENLSNSGYWCSPSPEQLEHLSLKQLAAVSNFVIGRRGYGCITFQHDVDLTAFIKSFREELFGKTVIFRSSKTVEVYPDEATKPIIGHGLNVPAIITLENVYPVDKKTKKPMKDTTKFAEFQILDKKLRNMREMNFISYNPFGGTWTFKVNHFSIWGLVNEEDAEIDDGDLSKQEDISEQPSKRVRTLAQSKPPSEEVVLKTNGTFGTLTGRDDSIIEEKAYEPDLSDADFEGIEVSPKLDVSKDWVEQLILAGSSLRSVFTPSQEFVGSCQNEIDLLFSEYNDEMDKVKNIMKERRFTAPYTFAKFSTGSMLLTKDIVGKSGVSIRRLPTELQREFLFNDMYLGKEIEKVAIESRKSNSYPQITESSLLFKDVLDYMEKSSSDYNLWKLSSILFDPVSYPYKTDNDQAKVALLKNERHRQLTSWIVGQISPEIKEKIKNSSNKIEQIFLYLLLNDVVRASKLAIESKNGHLSVLISYLGSNDPRIRDLAELQLQKWSTGGCSIDKYISKIYKLLSGSPFEGIFSLKNLESEFSWLCLLNLTLCYGQIDEYSLESLVQSHLDKFSLPYDDPIGVIFQLYAANENTEKLYKDVRQKTKALDVQFCWYLIQTLRFNKIRIFSKETSDEATFAFAAQLEFAQLHGHSLFVSCFLNNDKAAEDIIKRLVMREITLLRTPPNDHILNRLKIPSQLIFNSRALKDRYEGDYLSEVQNLLQGSSYDLAEKTIVTALGPRLLLSNDPIQNNELKTLRRILNEFPDSERDKWSVSINVFEDYLKLALDNVETPKTIDSLISGMKIFYDKCKHSREVPACCNVMSQEIVSKILKINSSSIGDLKGKLLDLPLGQPEKAYLKGELAQDLMKCTYKT
ncbi:nucleocytoplasmic transporter NUP145 [Saccharomyces paradoxus]|uniref:Nucleocytoplasmic transporter NUP145 n=1 Tax=Saccharomyces paradoxus TaxID=27291 RepID=A0A8B8UR60_SACPA|nr:Nup145 [Saccharomyces paradoxus]QHS73243.1 Nup145 [Saccharomyces paradoxus]